MARKQPLATGICLSSGPHACAAVAYLSFSRDHRVVWAAVDEIAGGINSASRDPVVLLGHSAGGHTVLEAAALRPDQTNALE